MARGLYWTPGWRTAFIESPLSPENCERRLMNKAFGWHPHERLEEVGGGGDNLPSEPEDDDEQNFDPVLDVKQRPVWLHFRKPGTARLTKRFAVEPGPWFTVLRLRISPSNIGAIISCTVGPEFSALVILLLPGLIDVYISSEIMRVLFSGGKFESEFVNQLLGYAMINIGFVAWWIVGRLRARNQDNFLLDFVAEATGGVIRSGRRRL